MKYAPQCEACGQDADCPEGSDLHDGLCRACTAANWKAEAEAEQAAEAGWLVAAEYCAEAQEDLRAA